MLGLSLGDKAWAEAATSMAQNAMSPGAPLRTMTLLSAGRPDLILGGGGVGMLHTGRSQMATRDQSGSNTTTGGGGGATPTAGGNVIASIFGIGKGGGGPGSDQTGAGASETEDAVSLRWYWRHKIYASHSNMLLHTHNSSNCLSDPSKSHLNGEMAVSDLSCRETHPPSKGASSVD